MLEARITCVLSLLTVGLCLQLPSASPPRCTVVMKGQAVAAKPKAKGGFGAKTAKTTKKKRAPVVQLPMDVQLALDELTQGEDASIEKYLNPKLFEDPETMQGISRQLRSGDVVILRDAFRPEFAEMVHAELNDKNVAWELNEAYFKDGYHHHHHNVYDRASWSARLNQTAAMFATPASQGFMQQLTGRDCTGETQGSPSWYQAGDHSLPHTDWVGQRTVAYVWHLSKDWRPRSG